jgi:hypothetical protein
MYYVVIQDAVSGPYSVEGLGQLLVESKITPLTLAVEEGHENWMALEKLIQIECTPAGVASAHGHGEECAHVSKRVKQGKECPFCGGTKIQTAAKEFFSTGFVRVFSPKVCKCCDAIWRPKVEISTAFLIFAAGIVGFAATAIIVGPEISYHIGLRENRPAPMGPSPLVNWAVGGVLVLVSFTAVRKSFRYLGSEKVRSFRVLRHPHRHAHG